MLSVLNHLQQGMHNKHIVLLMMITTLKIAYDLGALEVNPFISH